MKKTKGQHPITLAPGGGPTVTIMDVSLAYKVSGAETDGTWAQLEYTLPPGFNTMPLHWHKVTYQGFYVLEGKVTFQVGSQIFTAEKGAFISVPSRTIHKFSNDQDQPACVLETIIPSGFENSFKELVALAQVEPNFLVQPQKLFEVYKRYDTFMPEEL